MTETLERPTLEKCTGVEAHLKNSHFVFGTILVVAGDQSCAPFDHEPLRDE